jgi:hypothetical protein
MTFLYTQTEEAREREHVRFILERLKPGWPTKQSGARRLAKMPTEGGVQ